MNTFWDTENETGNQLEEKLGERHSDVLQCYKLTGLAKVSGIQNYIHDLLQNDLKLLIFAHHIDVLDGIEQEIRKMKLQYIRIDGTISPNKRYEQVKLFQENEDIKVAILSLTAAGTGLNFTAASNVVFAEVTSFCFFFIDIDALDSGNHVTG
ncbi:hypothetical protein A2495_03520 [Candidatus Curtissbacteria bacterium RIFOXYC12_FULL_41_11]|nr:MAG: hypothetical protein A2495_03520 [Candidatus Curtissbacteria bacterium RIFOXYC12_FULL_41_11]